MILTGGTLMAAARCAAGARGARAVYACATHAAFADGARAQLEASPFTRLLVTDTVPLLPGAPPADAASKIEVCSVAPMLAEAIERIHDNRSVSALFRRVAQRAVASAASALREPQKDSLWIPVDSN